MAVLIGSLSDHLASSRCVNIQKQDFINLIYKLQLIRNDFTLKIRQYFIDLASGNGYTVVATSPSGFFFFLIFICLCMSVVCVRAYTHACEYRCLWGVVPHPPDLKLQVVVII